MTASPSSWPLWAPAEEKRRRGGRGRRGGSRARDEPTLKRKYYKLANGCENDVLFL